MDTPDTLPIDPAQRQSHFDTVEGAFHRWHEEEWAQIPYDTFRQYASASFLIYVETFLSCANSQGEINPAHARVVLQRELGDYFREGKFENAVAFYIDGPNWEHL